MSTGYSVYAWKGPKYEPHMCRNGRDIHGTDVSEWKQADSVRMYGARTNRSISTRGFKSVGTVRTCGTARTVGTVGTVGTCESVGTCCACCESVRTDRRYGLGVAANNYELESDHCASGDYVDNHDTVDDNFDSKHDVCSEYSWTLDSHIFHSSVDGIRSRSRSVVHSCGHGGVSSQSIRHCERVDVYQHNDITESSNLLSYRDHGG